MQSSGTLTVSLHCIRLHTPIGVYEEEKILGNDFEVDVDLTLAASTGATLPFADYTRIHSLVLETFAKPAELLEEVIQRMHSALSAAFGEAHRIRIAIRKLHPPMTGEVGYAQVVFEI